MISKDKLKEMEEMTNSAMNQPRGEPFTSQSIWAVAYVLHNLIIELSKEQEADR